MRVAQGEVRADRPADGAARVAEALDAETVQRREEPVAQLGDGGGGVGGRAAVAGQVVAEDPPVLGQLGDLAIPHVPRRAERGSDDQDRGVLGPVEAVLKGPRGGCRCLRPLLGGWRLRAGAGDGVRGLGYGGGVRAQGVRSCLRAGGG